MLEKMIKIHILNILGIDESLKKKYFTKDLKYNNCHYFIIKVAMWPVDSKIYCCLKNSMSRIACRPNYTCLLPQVKFLKCVFVISSSKQNTVIELSGGILMLIIFLIVRISRNNYDLFM